MDRQTTQSRAETHTGSTQHSKMTSLLPVGQLNDNHGFLLLPPRLHVWASCHCAGGWTKVKQWQRRRHRKVRQEACSARCKQGWSICTSVSLWCRLPCDAAEPSVQTPGCGPASAAWCREGSLTSGAGGPVIASPVIVNLWLRPGPGNPAPWGWAGGQSGKGVGTRVEGGG